MLVASLALAAGVAVLLAPVEIERPVRGQGRVLPAQEWVLARTGDGAVTATLRDLRTGAVTTTFSAAPERGDAVRFDLTAVGEAVRAGEPVGAFASGEAALELAALRGEIEAAEAGLRLSRAGARAEVVRAAEEQVRQAEAEREQAARAAARQRELFEQGLAAAHAVEAAEEAAAAAQAAVAVAAAEREVVALGPRPEAVGVAEARVAQLRAEAAQLRARRAMDAITAPISGRVQRVFSPDTLLFVADTSAYHVLVPVRWEDRRRVRVGAAVTLATGDAEPARARVTDVAPAAPTHRGQAFLVATAEVVGGAERLVPGLRVPVAIAAEPATPLGLAREALGW